MNNEQQRDDELWQIAKARVNFRWSLVFYVLVSAILTAVWYLSSSHHKHFWPVWPMLGMGIALAFQYFHAYQGNPESNTRKEYEKLKKEQENQ